jgi:hypothetical protein
MPLQKQVESSARIGFALLFIDHAIFYVFMCIIWAFAISHLLIHFALSGLWCWWMEADFWEFQQRMLELLK